VQIVQDAREFGWYRKFCEGGVKTAVRNGENHEKEKGFGGAGFGWDAGFNGWWVDGVWRNV